VKKRYAKNVKEAFKAYLSKHTEFYVPFDKISVDEAAELIGKAKGLAVLAHPGFIGEAAQNKLLPSLREMGFWGIEAYHPSHSDGQCAMFESIARSYGLYITSGSDFHGSAKPGIEIGGETRGGEYLKASVRELMGNADVKDYL
jgi:predicted metal-dependent phosphoesterase TrpH